MKLDHINILLIVEGYGQEQWVNTSQDRLGMIDLGYYNFTTKDFLLWYNYFTVYTPVLPQPTLATFNIALRKDPNCNQICQETDLETSWNWHLSP
ncbi:hypothetical protein HR52_07440 [Aeromonas hydrophila]|nr:hypothetical protein HR52_07440 [Aeromonas hydrophila]OCY05871.1 hypothetical protein A9X69_14330 [Aeromonas hydrophila]OCY11280.1 hypothetical protein A9X70_00405 [Aeromonas hydrophila]TNI68336.1 hypothetical protein CF124_02310 [Aeromonas hydrophila]TNJ21471.1 hypothetical protein CF112_10820 [Aeromonas hydrophila]